METLPEVLKKVFLHIGHPQFSAADETLLRARLKRLLRCRIGGYDLLTRRIVPGGYEAVGRKWEQDRDPLVRAAYEAIFEAYLRLGSATKVARFLLENDYRLQRRRKGVVVPLKITPERIRRILKDPAYMGDYTSEFHSAKLNDSRTARLSIPNQLSIPNHHAPYVSPSNFARVQAMLKSRAHRKVNHTDMTR